MITLHQTVIDFIVPRMEVSFTTAGVDGPIEGYITHRDNELWFAFDNAGTPLSKDGYTNPVEAAELCISDYDALRLAELNIIIERETAELAASESLPNIYKRREIRLNRSIATRDALVKKIAA